VPVKIVLDQESTRGYESRLVPGLSVETDVSLTTPDKSSDAIFAHGAGTLAQAAAK